MSDTDSPVTGSGNDSALSLEDGAAAIENLLSSIPDEPETDEQDSATNEESENEGQDKAPAAAATDDEDEGLELDDEALAAEADAPKEPEIKAGQFAPKDAKVKLDDGSTISVAELIAGNMFQRTFTEKTTALKGEKNALEAERSQFAETKRQIEHERHVILTLTQKLLPKEPEPVDPNEDPVGYMQYLQARDGYQSTMNDLYALWNSTQQEQAKLTESQQKEKEEFERQQQEQHFNTLRAEQEELFKAIPALKDEKEREKFREDIAKVGARYGIQQPEIDSITDRRVILALADLAKYHRALAKRDAGKNPAPVQQQTPQPRIPQRQRMAAQSPQTRDANTAADRLRKTGSLDDAAKALMKFV